MCKTTLDERRTNYNDVELETTFEQFVLDLLGNRVKADVGGGTNFLDICGGHGGGAEVGECKKAKLWQLA
jgi:hypothetical protein